ncbi:MAG: zinc-ribbon domain-containing protein [Clostridia bacterium]|nr:zinc-ribbon domain-containing protein [Clostridia bacterium]
MLAIINSTQTTKPQNQYPQFQEADQIITCQGCGSQFYFTAGEQRFYKEKGLNIPKYCKTCRAKRNVKDPK